MMKVVIACNRIWCDEIAKRLAIDPGIDLTVIQNYADLTIETLRTINPRYVFFPHWSYIVPEEIYERYECVIFHMTDVPYGRGGSPLQNLIIRGHQDTMISALRCSRQIDAGPVYLKVPLSLIGSAEEIYIRAAALIGNMINLIISTQSEPLPQKGDVTLFERRKPEDGDWSMMPSLDKVYDMIRMLDADGYPPAFVRIGRYKIEFTRASRRVGSIIADVKIMRED